MYQDTTTLGGLSAKTNEPPPAQLCSLLFPPRCNPGISRQGG